MSLSKKEIKVLVTGAGGFIGGHLIKYLQKQGYRKIRAVDIKPLKDWHQLSMGVENLSLDLKDLRNCKTAVKNMDEVYNLAANMGGMGFIESNKALCMLNVLINTHMLLASKEAGVNRFFYSSSACVYAANKQTNAKIAGLKEEDAYPAMPEDGYGWEKLFSERLCRHFMEDFGLETRVARFHNVYGPFGEYKGGREKAPAALIRKVIEAKISGQKEIEIWGDGKQSRTFMYIDDCVKGIDLIMHSDIKEPINLGTNELVTVNELVDLIEGIAQTKLEHRYNPDAPKGVRGRSSDNTLIKKYLNWQPSISLKKGMKETYLWIEKEIKGSSKSSWFSAINNKINFFRILLVISSLIASLIFSLVILNFLIPYLCKNYKPQFIQILVDSAVFDPKYVFWGNSYCKTNCKNSAEMYSTNKVVSYNEDLGNCEKILFLGDSFTNSPWNEYDHSYTEYFVSNLAAKDQKCYSLVRVATSATNNDQQFARFLDIIDIIKPKMVFWQFCWNDFYENFDRPLYKLDNNGNFHREKSYANSYFWAGWLNQKFPFLVNTNLGNFLLYFGEKNNNFFINESEVEGNLDSLINSNENKIIYFLDRMKFLAKKYDFKLATTISPLECELVFSEGCGILDELDNTDAFIIQTSLVDILKRNSKFVSMSDSDSLTKEQIFNQSDFSVLEKNIGTRHLEPSGQEKAGNILFLNFISNNQSIHENY